MAWAGPVSWAMTTGITSYSPHGGGHHRGIGRAIELPYRALIDTLLLVVIPLQLINVVLNIGYLILDVKLIFVATLV